MCVCIYTYICVFSPFASVVREGYEKILGNVRLRKGLDPSWPTPVAAIASEKCVRWTAGRHILFLISSLPWHLLPPWAGQYLCTAGPLFPSRTSPVCLSKWGPSYFLWNLHPSQIAGAPRSGIDTISKVRKKDQKDPREKRFTSLVLFIILCPSHWKLLLPVQWLHCVPLGTALLLYL